MKSKNTNYFGIVFWVHLFLIILAYLSPFLVNWWLVLVGILILNLQYFVFGGCVLTQAEFGKNISKSTFYYHYLKKPSFQVDKSKIFFMVRVGVPIVVIILALVWQIVFKNQPIWF